MTFEADLSVSGTRLSRASRAWDTRPVKAVSQFGTKMRVNAASLLRRFQISRMKSVLMSMSDDQLAQINVTRTDVAQYAESLISDV